MIGKKMIALLVTGGMIASIGVSAGAYTKVTSSKVKATKTVQSQKQFMRPMENGRNDIKAQIDALVKSGKITQAVEDKVITYLNKMDVDRKAEMDKVKAMTEADRKTYFDSKAKVQKSDMFAEMVKSGTLSQTEADALKAALPVQSKGEGMMRMGERQGRGQGFNNVNRIDMQNGMKTKLDTLVKAGTMTQATEDNVIAYYTKMDLARKTEMDKVNTMTAADRKAYMDSKVKTERLDPLADLVKAGILTQSQADAIKKISPEHQMGHGMPGGRH